MKILVKHLLKNFIISIKAKTAFQLIPVGPFKEKSKFKEKKIQKKK